MYRRSLVACGAGCGEWGSGGVGEWGSWGGGGGSELVGGSDYKRNKGAFWSDKYIHYFDCHDGFTSVFICQSLLS